MRPTVIAGLWHQLQVRALRRAVSKIQSGL
jgi:hypothetical protein